jgi:hypothetical protein
MKPTKRARDEIARYKLDSNPDYLRSCAMYMASAERVWGSVPTRNMVKALRMLPFLNTPDDGARLHVTEWALKNNRTVGR